MQSDKRCTKCLTVKHIADFYFNSCNNRYQSECKDCQNARLSKYRAELPKEKQNHSNELRKQWRRANPASFLLSKAKNRAKEQGIPFLLTKADIVIPNNCPVLGIPLQPSEGRAAGSPSLDRVIPELGYVPGNVVVISRRANELKRDATVDELVKLAEFYSNHFQST